MNIILKNIAGFEDRHRSFIETVANKTIPIINWQPWRIDISSSSFNENLGLSGAEVLEKMEKGDDEEGDCDLDLKSFHSLSNTLAYTYLFSGFTWINTAYLDRVFHDGLDGEAEVAKTFIHEYSHRIGFKHARLWGRMNTVPYGTGRITMNNYLKYYNMSAKPIQLVENKINIKIG